MRYPVLERFTELWEKWYQLAIIIAGPADQLAIIAV